MSYNLNDLTKLSALKALAKKINDGFATKSAVNLLDQRIDDLVTAGGEPNKIETIKVNGTAQEIVNKSVDLAIPTKVSDLANDSNYQTGTEVAATIATTLAALDHLERVKVDSIDAIDLTADGADRYIYMVPRTDNKSGNLYDEYMILDGQLERVGDWEVDLSGYVQKEDGKGLSSNDFTNADKEKLEGISAGATKVSSSTIPGNIKIDDVEVAVVSIAKDNDVGLMLNDIFGAPYSESFEEIYGITLPDTKPSTANVKYTYMFTNFNGEKAQSPSTGMMLKSGVTTAEVVRQMNMLAGNYGCSVYINSENGYIGVYDDRAGEETTYTITVNDVQVYPVVSD